jgi:pimeloyl-ACP methyl ester carboxylesterase
VTTLLLHGLGADRRQPLGIFESVVREVVGPDELIVAPDVRAHGGFLAAGEPSDFAMPRLAAEVAGEVRSACTAAGVVLGEDGGRDGSLTVIGISMGAAIGLRIALDSLLPIRRAAFVRPAFDDRPLPDNLRPFPVIGQILADAGPAGVDEFQERGVFRQVVEASPAGGRALLAQFQAPDAARRAMRLVEIPRNRAFEHDDELATLPARGIRSLVVGAPRDPVHPFPIAERWAGGLRATLDAVPARDDGQAAQTAALQERVGRWLRRG